MSARIPTIKNRIMTGLALNVRMRCPLGATAAGPSALRRSGPVLRQAQRARLRSHRLSLRRANTDAYGTRSPIWLL